MLLGTALVGSTDLPYIILRYTASILLFKNFTLSEDRGMHKRTQRIHTAYPYPVQTTGYFIGIFIKFTTGVKYRHNDLQGRFTFFRIDAGRDTTAIIFYGNRVVGIDNDFDIFTVSCQSLIDRVIHDLINKVVQAFHSRVPDIH
ncbi:hypothetical protein D3C80_1373610 [compost metagenome]